MTETTTALAQRPSIDAIRSVKDPDAKPRMISSLQY